MEDFCRRHHGAILVGLLVLGLTLRTYHYLADPPMWHDEAAQVINILDKSFADFQGPLFFAEASPPAFMWVLKGWTLVFGDSTLALRFLPWLASCLALALMVWLGRRLLPWPGALALALLFACSDRLLWHTCEAKAYTLDVLVTVALLGAFTMRSADLGRGGGRKYLLLAALCPALLFLSFPACFVLGALALCWLSDVWRARDWSLWWRFGVFGLILGSAFLLLLLGPIRAQQVHALQDDWAWNNPRWQEPWTIPYDLLRHVTEVFRYVSEPVGNVLAVLAVVGGWVWWRHGQRRLLAFLVLPLGLNALAWLMGRYPLGASRVNVYLAPLLLLLVAAGFRPAWLWLRQRLGSLGPALVGLLLAIPLGSAGYRLIQPWDRLDSREPAQFILRHRQTDEPVVGTMWEHQYYFRGLRQSFRLVRTGPHDPPTLPLTAVSGGAAGEARHMWLMGNSRDDHPRRYLPLIDPDGAWEVREEHHFATMTVLRLTRGGDELAARRD